MKIKDKSFRFNLDAEEYAILENEAARLDISMASVLRQYIRSLKLKQSQEAITTKAP